MARNPILEATNQNISPNTTQTTNQSQNPITMIAQFNKLKKKRASEFGKEPSTNSSGTSFKWQNVEQTV